MPENLQDTPARFEENEEYLKDKFSTKGKPYSSKQIAANLAHARRITLYHKTLNSEQLGRKVFDIDQVDQALKEGWKDTPYIHPRCPKIKVVKPEQTPELEEPEQPLELEALKAEAIRLGINIRGTWGVKKLKKAIKAA